MLLRRSLMAFVLIGAAAPAFAACTEADLQTKTLQLNDIVKALSAKNPPSAAGWKKKQIDADRVAQSTTDLDTICAAYDKTIAEAKAAQ